ncbi:TPA: GNAT family N-acetyltransferase [Streptococcus suis]|nr:GNAT family N-acetyltransferase [Streptococcus suis]NQG20032.1 GNAT family N-acetyltransferase [Streptococcus suis]NQJ71298.1 GNAT family N-acetyltransferase [Streptococcus suis]NQR20451.1 GNAT family N-acetyltransferase [Streptococcus suis]HEL2072334.1 GNAT family N-acetyltransferase [Streptococcus suis]
MIELREISDENFYDCLHIDSGISKEDYVDSVEFSLAEAWSLRPFSHPRAIYNGMDLIGYVSLYCKDRNGEIINFVIDKQYQGKGLGRKAVEVCIDYLQTEHSVTQISLPVHEKHLEARKFWKKLGFQESNNIEDDYIFMRRIL